MSCIAVIYFDLPLYSVQLYISSVVVVLHFAVKLIMSFFVFSFQIVQTANIHAHVFFVHFCLQNCVKVGIINFVAR